MQTLTMVAEDVQVDFPLAKRLADAAAATLLGQATCLAWYDRRNNRQSPAHVDCHDGCEKPGCIDYAASRGAELLVTVGHGDFIFCYRPLGEFG